MASSVWLGPKEKLEVCCEVEDGKMKRQKAQGVNEEVERGVEIKEWMQDHEKRVR